MNAEHLSLFVTQVVFFSLYNMPAVVYRTVLITLKKEKEKIGGGEGGGGGESIHDKMHSNAKVLSFSIFVRINPASLID